MAAQWRSGATEEQSSPKVAADGGLVVHVLQVTLVARVPTFVLLVDEDETARRQGRTASQNLLSELIEQGRSAALLLPSRLFVLAPLYLRRAWGPPPSHGFDAADRSLGGSVDCKQDLQTHPQWYPAVPLATDFA